jgi:hypothetical protein
VSHPLLGDILEGQDRRQPRINTDYFLKTDEILSCQNVKLVKDIKTIEELPVIEILASQTNFV